MGLKMRKEEKNELCIKEESTFRQIVNQLKYSLKIHRTLIVLCNRRMEVILCVALGLDHKIKNKIT